LTSPPDRILSKCRRSRHRIPTPLATAPSWGPRWFTIATGHRAQSDGKYTIATGHRYQSDNWHSAG